MEVIKRSAPLLNLNVKTCLEVAVFCGHSLLRFSLLLRAQKILFFTKIKTPPVCYGEFNVARGTVNELLFPKIWGSLGIGIGALKRGLKSKPAALINQVVFLSKA